MSDPITLTSLAAAWKLLGTLYDKYAAWDVRRKTSKEAEQMKTRAQALMQQINQAILSGSSSDDPAVKPLVAEFKTLLAKGTQLSGAKLTQEWIHRSSKSGTPSSTTKRVPAKKMAAKKPPAHKSDIKTDLRVAVKKAPPKKTAASKSPTRTR